MHSTAASPLPLQFQIYVFVDGTYVSDGVFNQRTVTVGRSETADISLQDDRVAPYHAVFSFDGDRATIVNLTKGLQTLVNGEAVDQRRVGPRDDMTVGPYTLKLKVSPAPKPAPPHPGLPTPKRRQSQDAFPLQAEFSHATVFDWSNKTSPLRRIEAPTRPILPAVQRAPEPTVIQPAPARPSNPPDEDEFDEEEEDANARPGFSLVSSITGPASLPSKGQALALEIVAFSGDDLRSAHVLRDTGDQLRLGLAGVPSDPRFDGLRLVRVRASRQVELQFPASARGHLQRQDTITRLEDLKLPRNAVGRDRFRVLLPEGTAATLTLGRLTYQVRFVPRPAAVPKLSLSRPDPFFLRAFTGAIIGHFVIGMLLVLVAPKSNFAPAKEAYAQIDAQPPRDVEVRPEPPPSPPPEPLGPLPPRPRKKRKRRRRRRKVARTRRSVKKAGVLGAMGRLSRRAPGAKSIVSAAASVDAVRAPGGSDYRVGALVSKSPTSSVRLGGGGGGKPLTRGSAALLRGGTGRLGKKGSKEVRGRVGKVSSRRLIARGSISREEVARVINQHLSEVQYCYERALIKKPGLKGKLVLEWRIERTGRVGRVRQKVSTLRSAEVSSCIIRKLKGWRFPKPRGGVVVVSYPFIFSSVGF